MGITPISGLVTEFSRIAVLKAFSHFAGLESLVVEAKSSFP